MKKSLLALAVLGAFAGTAGAQTAAPAPSSVTLYGIMDAGVLRNDPKYGPADQTWNLASGNRNGSRFGFRGSESVGNGLNVIFTAEGGIGVDDGRSLQGTGTQGRLFGRQIFVGLQGAWGEVRLGRQMGPSFDYFGAIDPFGTGYGDAGMQKTFAGANGLRIDNTIMYRTPIVAGLQGLVGYSFNYGNATAANAPQGEVPSLNNNVNVQMAGLFYNSPVLPLVVAASYEKFNCPDITGTAGNPAIGGHCSLTRRDDYKEYQVGATYDLKLVKLHAAYGKQDDAFALGFNSQPTIPDATSWLGGVTVPLAGGRVLGMYQRFNDQTKDQVRAAQVDYRTISAGYEYDLSRRTILWVYYADSASKNGIGSTGGPANPQSAYDRKQYALGIRHAF
ncbi:porin [soil metagenome]